MGLLWQEYWSGLPFPSPGDLPEPGIEPRCPSLQADSLPGSPGKPLLVWSSTQKPESQANYVKNSRCTQMTSILQNA